jgi:hypothetical protein
MASKKMLVHLDLVGNRIENGGFESLAAAPASPTEGQQYFDTASKKVRLWDGTAWVDTGTKLIVTPNANTPALTVDSATTPGTAILAIADASGAESGLMTATEKNAVDNATDINTNSTIVKRDAAGSFSATSINITGTPTNANDAATKSYVDGLISSGMEVKGGFDCSANPNYPAADLGDAYYVTVDGKIGGGAGEVVKTGDLILCTATTASGDEATVGNSWIVLERNIDLATTTVSGSVRLATPAEVTAGTAIDAVTTVKDVSDMVTAATGGSYIANLASGSSSYTVVHSLGGSVLVNVYEKATGDYVAVDVSRTDANTIVITTNVALPTDHVVMCVYAGAQPA